MSSNEKGSIVTIDQSDERMLSCNNDLLGMGLISCTACPLSFDNKIFPNISCLNRDLTAGTDVVSVSLGNWPLLFSGNKSKSPKTSNKVVIYQS